MKFPYKVKDFKSVQRNFDYWAAKNGWVLRDMVVAKDFGTIRQTSSATPAEITTGFRLTPSFASGSLGYLEFNLDVNWESNTANKRMNIQIADTVGGVFGAGIAPFFEDRAINAGDNLTRSYHIIVPYSDLPAGSGVYTPYFYTPDAVAGLIVSMRNDAQAGIFSVKSWTR